MLLSDSSQIFTTISKSFIVFLLGTENVVWVGGGKTSIVYRYVVVQGGGEGGGANKVEYKGMEHINGTHPK